MSNKKRHIKWIPVFVFGAVAAVSIYLWQAGHGWTVHGTVGCALAGMFGTVELYRGIRGFRRALQIGVGNWIGLWTVFGGLLGGALGLLIRHCNTDDHFAWLYSESRLTTWILWTVLGALLSLWEASLLYNGYPPPVEEPGK